MNNSKKKDINGFWAIKLGHSACSVEFSKWGKAINVCFPLQHVFFHQRHIKSSTIIDLNANRRESMTSIVAKWMKPKLKWFKITFHNSEFVKWSTYPPNKYCIHILKMFFSYFTRGHKICAHGIRIAFAWQYCSFFMVWMVLALVYREPFCSASICD